MLTPRPFAPRKRSVSLLVVVLFGLSIASPSFAQNDRNPAIAALHPAAQANRIGAKANLAPQMQLTGHIPAWVTSGQQTATAVDLSTPIRVSLVLRRDPSVEAALEQLLADQQNPASPLFHQWLTPQQIGALYGPTQSDLDAITSWTTSQGLILTSVEPSRVVLELSGNLATLSSAFHTSFAYFNIGEESRLSATTEPSIPAAFGSVVQAVRGLTEVRYVPQSIRSRMAVPATGLKPNVTFTDGSHLLLPNDFSTIYDIASVYSGGNKGATIGNKAQRVAIIGRSRVLAADITNYENLAGLPSIQPNIVLAGADPGSSNVDDQGEATLDVDRVIGTAPGATADLVLAASTTNEDGVDIAIGYNINTLQDPVMTISFGSCEIDNGAAETNSLNTEFQTAAAEGISTFISAGDSGAAGCESSGGTPLAGQSRSINALCASPYVTCVGGTEFNDTANPSLYWSSTNASSGYESALSYIPEGAWNEPTGTNSKGQTVYQVSATGGGASIYIAKPVWQAGTGVPADNARDTPDVSFNSALHDGYMACFTAGGEDCTTYVAVFGGTSAAAPSMAGVAALLNTKEGSAQGNINPRLYAVASSTPAAFHDATIATSGVISCSISTASLCNNSLASSSSTSGGLAGYALQTGFDEATGLGSLDVAKFLAAAVTSTVSTTLAVTASPSPVQVNQAVTLTATLTPGTSPSTPTGMVQFYSNNVAIGSPVTIGSNVATLSYTFTTAGTDSIYAIYTGDTNFATSTSPTISLVINAATFTITPASTTYNLISGAATGNTDRITVASVNNFAATLQLSCALVSSSGTAAGGCSLTPNAVTLAAGGFATSTLTITTTTGTSGVLTFAVSGTGGSTKVTSAVITVNLTASAFTLIASPASLPTSGNLFSGNTVTSTITAASTNGFAGTIALTCSAANRSGTGTAAGSCSVSPSSVTVTSGGTGTSTLTIVTTAGTSGVLTAAVTGTGTTANSSIAATASTTVTANVVTPGFTLTPATASLILVSGAATGNTTPVTVTSTYGFAGAVTLSCTAAPTTGTAAGTCSASPATVSLAAGGSATSTISLTSTPGTSGVLTLSVSGTAGSISATAPTPVITATLTAASFTLSPSPATLNFTSGASSGNTDTVTLTSVGFVGSVAVSCTVSASSAADQPTCAATPPSALTSGGTATSVISISSTAAHDIAATQRAQLERRWTAGAGAFCAMLFFIPVLRRHRGLRSFASLCLLVVGLAALSGCGGGGSTALTSSAGTYTVTVQGTGSTSGSSTAVTATTTFSLIIN